MKFKLTFAIFTIFALSIISHAQNVSNEVRSSAAFAEVVLRMAELESQLEELLVSYTEEFPKVKESRYELSVLQNDLNYMARMKPSEHGKLTQALGKLLVRKAELATDYWVIEKRYNKEHPDAKKAKRKLDIFEKAVAKIL